MKVLIVNRYMGLYGGAETVVKEMVMHLVERGVTTRVIALNISDEVRARCQGIDMIIPAKNFPYAFRSTSLGAAAGIVQEMRYLRAMVKGEAKKFDLINVHNFPAEWVTWGLKKPVVWLCNEVPDFYNNPRPPLSLRLVRSLGICLDKFIVNRNIHSIVVADEFNAKTVKQRYDRCPFVVPYGIEFDFFSQEPGKDILKKYNITDNFVLLQVGMLSPEKNQLKSIQALEELKEMVPNLKLVLAGRLQSPYVDILKKYIVEKNLEDKIFFTGHITKEEVRNWYYACDIALFPVKTQGGWLAPFEALSTGKPVIVSTTMGAASLIKNENIGVVSDDLVNSIKKIYSDYDSYKAMANRGRSWVKDNLTWRIFTEKMLRIFEETLNYWRQS